MNLATGMRPLRIPIIADLTLERWLFALRIFIAVMLALGASFWLQLDGASTAGVCVGILAMQTRGQVIEKAAYRLLGTIVGCVAAIAITSAFSEVRDLYIIAYAAWLGLCVFAAGFLDGNRAYGAVLCGYTVSLVALPTIDNPDGVFDAAINRGAAIVVGIAAITIVNSLFPAPEIAASLSRRTRTGQSRVKAFVKNTFRSDWSERTDTEAAEIFRVVSEGRPEIGALSTESLRGDARAAAARTLAAAFIGEVGTMRRMALLQKHKGDDPALHELAMNRHRRELDTWEAAELDAVQRLDTGDYPDSVLGDTPAMPIYRPWQHAARNGLQAFIVSIVFAIGLILAGLADASFALALAAVVIGLGANSPDPRSFVRAAIIAMPLSIALGGITLFVILDGRDSFPLLCIGLAPSVIGSALLLTSPNPKRAGVGFLTLVFVLLVAAPSNPQIYDPETYLMTAVFLIVSVLAALAGVTTLFPTEDADRRRWVFQSARKALRNAIQGRAPEEQAEGQAEGQEAEQRFLDASRVAALSSLKDKPEHEHAADTALLLLLVDLRFAVQRVWIGLARLNRNHALAAEQEAATQAVHAGLAAADAGVLRQAAQALKANGGSLAFDAAADVAVLASLVDLIPSMREPPV
jgi:uncharacterized membrane protein YccC